MYVLTRAINEYDQHGEYLVTVFDKAPSLNDIIFTLECSEQTAEHILNGGGRVEYEYEWFYLTEIKSGELYNHYTN